MTRVQVWKINFNGQDTSLEPVALPVEASNSLDSASRQLPGGSYTTFRTFDHNKVFRLADHLQRLKTSAQLLGRNGMPFSQPDLRAALGEVAKQLPAEESRIRLTMDLQQKPGTVYVSTEKLTLLLLRPTRKASIWRLPQSSAKNQRPRQPTLSSPPVKCAGCFRTTRKMP